MKNLKSILFLFVVNVAFAQDVSYLKQMPNPEKINSISGINELDTYYRRMASLSILTATISDLSGRRRYLIKGGLTDQEKTLIERYKRKSREIWNEAKKKYPDLNERKIIDYSVNDILESETYALMGEVAQERVRTHKDSVDTHYKNQAK